MEQITGQVLAVADWIEFFNWVAHNFDLAFQFILLLLPLIKYEAYTWIVGIRHPTFTFGEIMALIRLLMGTEEFNLESAFWKKLFELNLDWLLIADILAVLFNLRSFLASAIAYAVATYNLYWN